MDVSGFGSSQPSVELGEYLFPHGYIMTSPPNHITTTLTSDILPSEKTSQLMNIKDRNVLQTAQVLSEQNAQLIVTPDAVPFSTNPQITMDNTGNMRLLMNVADLNVQLVEQLLSSSDTTTFGSNCEIGVGNPIDNTNCNMNAADGNLKLNEHVLSTLDASTFDTNNSNMNVVDRKVRQNADELTSRTEGVETSSQMYFSGSSDQNNMCINFRDAVDQQNSCVNSNVAFNTFNTEMEEDKLVEMEEDKLVEDPSTVVQDVLMKKTDMQPTRTGDIRIDITSTKSVIIKEYKGGLHAYIWKKEHHRPTVKDLKALFRKKSVITDAIMTILIAGEYDL